MTNKLTKGILLDVTDIESQYSDLKLVYKIGKGDWANHLYFIPSENLYIEKGAFGTHDAICYKVCEFNDEQGAIAWKSDLESYWKKYFPNIKLE